MKAKKIVALVAAAAMVLSMAACGSTDNSSSDAKDGSAAAETTKTSDSDTLVMATNATFPPYEYVDGEEYKGIDIEIAQAIADGIIEVTKNYNLRQNNKKQFEYNLFDK